MKSIKKHKKNKPKIGTLTFHKYLTNKKKPWRWRYWTKAK